MKMAVIGTGYVGIISAVGWAGLGHDITCIDVDKEKIGKVKLGIPPIFEKDLEGRLKGVIGMGRLKADVSFSAVKESDLVLISVGTPSGQDGGIDTAYVRSAAEAIARELKASKRFVVVAVRSTVVPGTTEGIVGETLVKSGKRIGVDFGLAMIPEFLKEGTALEDFDNPDRVVAGCSDEKTKAVLEGLYGPFKCPKLFVDIKTAEMIKYASNSFLATKISFANEIASMCERFGIDVDDVMKGTGMDARIGPHFLVAGAGFGGSCFPKDVKALVHKAKESGLSPKLLESVLDVNHKQQEKMVSMLESIMSLRGKKVAVLGLAFKAGTDDVRESASLTIIRKLLDSKAMVQAYDPQGMENAKRVFPDISYSKDWAGCLSGCDAALLVTAWPEFIKSAVEYKKALGDAPLIDARRILKKGEAKKAGLRYIAIGRGGD
jgi:UDPglucose 6-dehydrogenase